MKKRLLGGSWEYLLKGIVLVGMCLHFLINDRDQIDAPGYLFMAVFLVLGVGFLVWAGRIILANQRVYEQFFDCFPELNGQLANLETSASFIDAQFGLLIYKNHLVAYGTGQFTDLSLEEVSSLRYYKIFGGFKRLPKAFLVANRLNRGKPAYLPIRALTLNNPKIWLEDLHRETIKDFPHITYQ